MFHHLSVSLIVDKREKIKISNDAEEAESKKVISEKDTSFKEVKFDKK